LKLIIASLIVFSLIILFLFALFPSDISVSRIVQIKSSRTEVSKKITDLREWKNWNKFLFNALARDSMSETRGTIDSGHIGMANVTVDLLEATPDTVITRWQHEGKSFTGNFIFTEMNGQTVLEWTLNFHLKWYPWQKLASMFYEKKLGPLMEESLISLRKELEKPAGLR
jgi:hypothetical protein